MDIHSLLSRLKNVKQSGEGWTALCPVSRHDDKKNSLAVGLNQQKILVHCHAGCALEEILYALNLNIKDLFLDNHSNNYSEKKMTIAATYDYRDENGNLLFQVCRIIPKDFRQRRPDGNGGWIWDMKDVRRVIYRLREVIEAVNKDRTVYIVEGEKDVHSLEKLGLTATTNAGGAGKWLKEYSIFFNAGNQVVILPDNDQSGRDHAKKVASQLKERDVKVKIVELPGLPEKGDVSDWLAGGGTVKELLELVGSTPEWELEIPLEEKENAPWLPDTRLAINANIRELVWLNEQALKALCLANKDKPFLFLRGGPVRLESDKETGNLITRELTQDRLRYELARAARWYKLEGPANNLQEIPAKPPMDVCKDILATPELPFPILTTFTEVPIFDAAGTLIKTPGYHTASGIYYSPIKNLIIPEIPENPTKDFVDNAKELIMEELLGDFPFATQSDHVNAVALMLLPFVRSMITGPTPLHLIEASTQGSGKGLLSEILMYSAIGNTFKVSTLPKDEDELRKNITSTLAEGYPVVCFDNVYSLTSGILAAALTAEIWDDRLLGKNEKVFYPIRCVWIATSNNAIVSTDIARRTIRIRLIPSSEKPWLRKPEEFRHPDLKIWVDKHRSDIIWAILILVKNWLAKGQPQSTKIISLGKYESWSKVIGGILEAAGIDGFMANILDLYEASDMESEVWRRFVRIWWEEFGSLPVGIKELFLLAESIDEMALRGTTERAQRTKFGIILNQKKDRIFDGYKIIPAGFNHRVKLWRLDPIEVEKE